MPNTKPYVSVACICEKVLHENDGVLSAIRLVDTFFVEELSIGPQGAVPVEPAGVPAIHASALVVLKSGDVTGKSELSVKMRTPGGKTTEMPERWPVLLNGGEHGVQLTLNFVLPAQEFGLYWFDVCWEGDVLTSIPFKLVRGPRPATEPGTR